MAKRKAKVASRTKPGRRAIALHKTSDLTRTRVFRGIHQVLREHGIAGRVAAVHLTAARAADAGAEPCPDGQIRRIVCTQQDDGTVVCEEKCVPV